MTASEIVWLFLLSWSSLIVLVQGPPRLHAQQFDRQLPRRRWLAHRAARAGSPGDARTLLLYFAEAGAFVFGSGLAIVPFLHGGVVDQFHWLTERQFLDAVAVAMITPGPVVITVAFIGFLVAGFARARPRQRSACSCPATCSSSPGALLPPLRAEQAIKAFVTA